MASYDYEEILERVLSQMKRLLVLNKPHLIHVIQYGESGVTRKEANEIIKRMVSNKKIDEHLALSKKERPYSFYTVVADTDGLEKMTARLLQVLGQGKKLSITDVSQLTGYSQRVVRTLLTHLLLEGVVDYRGDLASPIFYIPCDVK